MKWIMYPLSMRPFLSWLIVTAMTCTGVTWAYFNGVVGEAIKHDNFHVVTIIFAWFVLATVVIGAATFHLERGGLVTPSVKTSSRFAWFSTGNLLNLGLIGTVYGFIAMLESSFTGKNFSDPSSIPSLLPIIGENWATALYATAAGITFNVALSVQSFILSAAIKNREEP